MHGNSFSHLRLMSLDEMKNKSIHKNPTTKSHRKQPYSFHPAANANFSVQPQPLLESSKPASSKKVKVEDDGTGKKSDCDSQPRFPVNVTRSNLFTDEDEIVILQGIIEYAKSKNVPLPLANLVEFYPFVKAKLSSDVSNSQIYEKIRRLKNKYLKTLKNKWDAPIPSNNHDFEVFMLCKKIWADVERMAVDDAVSEPDEMECHDDDKDAFSLKYPLLMESLKWDNAFSFSKIDSVRENLHLIGSEKATELELIWMELQSKEFEIHSKKANFKMELIRLVLNAGKRGGEPSSSALPMQYD